MKSVEELVNENTLNKLKEMYEQRFGIECLNRKKKDIAYAIWMLDAESIRTEDLSKTLNSVVNLQ